ADGRNVSSKALSISLFISCNNSSLSSSGSGDENAELKKGIMENYAKIVFANYQDALIEAENMKDAIDAFVENPESVALFNAAKEAWLTAREPYGQTEAFRFSNGPIDDADGPEGLLNAWPMDESYVDYVAENASAGIINDLSTYPNLTKSMLEELNEAGGEENVAVGYHAIEFLLWGQDNTSPSELKSGQRPNTDFVDGGTALNPDRRRLYLQLCAELLVENLQNLVAEWDPNDPNNYRATFLELPTDQALQNMLTGIGVLSKSELAGERIFTAYDNQDQEDEHSCFADNTHRDTRLNAMGIQNVYTGRYERIDGGTIISGPSLSDLMMEEDPEFSQSVIDQMDKAMEAVRATGIPFDNAISDPSTRPNVLASVYELRAFGDRIAEVGNKLNLTINTALPN
ncbi:MAG: imelysin family protein, partial [Bacteroidota bacterium]